MRRRRGGGRRDAAARLDRERAPRADHRSRPQRASRLERGLRRTVLDEARRRAGPRVARSTRRAAASTLRSSRSSATAWSRSTQPLKGQASAYRTVRVVTLTAQGHDIAGATTDAAPEPAAEARPQAERQRVALDLLQARPTASKRRELRRDGIGAQTLARAGRAGPDALSRRESSAIPFELAAVASSEPSRPLVLTDEQSAALERARDAGRRRARFSRSLLHGVTGSGKTEIYLRLARDSARRGPRRAPARAGDRADAGRRRGRSGARSATAWRSSTAGSPTASVTINGIASGAATSTSSSAPGRRCSRRCERSG